MAAGLFLVNILDLGLFLLRAKSHPAERKGWLIWAGSVPLVFASLGVLAAAGPLQGVPSPLDWTFLALSLVIGLVQAWGLLAWPWRSTGKESNLLDLLGSLLFGSSIFLLMWVIGIWQLAFQGHAVIHTRTLAYAGRLAITSGVGVYLFSQDPRRIRGPLGWVLAAMGIFSLTIGLLQPLIQSAGAMGRISPWFAVAILAPVFLAFAAWSRHPAEVSPEGPTLQTPLAEAVPHIPFLIAGGVLGVALFRSKAPLIWPLLTFLGITGLLVLRQFILLREVRAANARLEERVAQRTQSLEKMQALMLRTERMNTMATLGAGLAHDLNNLLGAIRNSAELMQMEVEEGQAPSHRDLTRIMEASGKAGGLTHRLMAFARQETSLESHVHLELTEAVVSMEELLRMMLPRSIQLDCKIEVFDCLVPIDSTLLEQVLVNLVSNAKDAMPEGGKVTIRLHPGSMPGGGPAAILEVSDTGPGIPPEIQESIFDSFFTTKPEGKGTGLGLASVKALMEAQEGTIHLESRSDRGATFILAFPIRS